MEHHFTCAHLFIIYLWLSACEPTRCDLNQSGTLIKFLYGDQWRLDEYCGDSRATRIVLASDSIIESLYNGTYLQSIDDTPDWSTALERIDRANLVGSKSRREYSLMCSINSWGYADKLTENLANKPHENDHACGTQIEEFYAFVRRLVLTRRALTIDCDTQDGNACNQKLASGYSPNFTLNHWLQLNSFGRLSPGRPYRNNLLIGDYDTCLQLSSTRYCLGAYDKESRAGSRVHEVDFPFRVGLCLPKSCTARFLRHSAKYMRLLNYVVKANIPDVIDGGDFKDDIPNAYQLIDLHCPPTDDSPLRKAIKYDLLSQVLLFYLPIAWLLMLVTGTLTHNPTVTKDKRSQFHMLFIKPFDLRLNWSSFWAFGETNSKLAGLDGVKVLAMNWLFASHVSMTIHGYLSDTSSLQPYTLQGAIVLQGQHGVSIFFIISGLLVAMKHLRSERVDALSMIIARYFRLLPMYLLVYAYVKKFLPLLGDGPLWDYGVSIQSEARQCSQESWMTPIFMLANFTPPFAQCIITGWHIANDFQIYLVLPLLFWVYRMSRQLGRKVVLITICLTHATHIWVWGSGSNYEYRLFALQPFLFGPRVVLERLVIDYVNPIGRLGTYFLGVLVADKLLSLNEVEVRQATRGREIMALKSACPPTTARNNPLARTTGEVKTLRTNNEPTSTLDSYCKPKARKNLHDMNKDQRLLAGSQVNNDDARNLSQSSRDTTTNILLAISLACGPLLAVLLPSQIKLMFPHLISKAINYPLLRFSVEIGWSMLIYYLLRDNFKRAAETKRRPLEGHAGHSALAIGQTTTACAFSATTAVSDSQALGCSLLKKPAWSMLVKLNYTLMLTHYPLIRYVVQSQRQLIAFTWFNYFQLTTFLLLVAYAISLLVHLAVEMPLAALVRLLVARLTTGGQRQG